MKAGIIVQARTGSTRLPQKVVLPFYQGKSILQIILERLQANRHQAPVILATTTAPGDDAVANLGKEIGVKVFRGSENNVLQRFIDASGAYGINRILRVCADNPFLHLASVDALLDAKQQADYLSFTLDGERPTILSHIGLFTELTHRTALLRARASTKDTLYLEHVTNFLYKHANYFESALIPAPKAVYLRNDIRLTLDTPEDFAYQQELYQRLSPKTDIDVTALLDLIENDPGLQAKMLNEIQRNQK